MIVHISLFFLKDPGTAGEMVAALEQVPRDNPAISTSLVGRNLVVLPPHARGARVRRRGPGHHL